MMIYNDSKVILNKELEVTTGKDEYWTPVLRIHLNNWHELTQIIGNVEVTNDLGYNVSVVGKFYVAQNRDDIPKSSGNPKASPGFEHWITDYSNGGPNVTPDMHHCNIFLHDAVMPNRTWTRNVIYALRATSSRRKPGHKIQVGGGKLITLRNGF